MDCHLPHDFAAKYVAKAENGYHHSKGFTLQDFHEPIMIKPRNAAILQGNCLACHGDMVHGLLRAITATRTRSGACTATGRGHGEPAGLGGPERGDEFETAADMAVDVHEGKRT